jgi:sulfoxide reductase heme-binding subunit YedZ
MFASAQAAAHSSKLLWYLTRSSGLVATVLLTVSVVLGILTTIRVSGPGWPRFLISAMHRNVSLFVMVVVFFHVAVAVLDAYAPLAWVDAVLPLHSGYRPVWTGLGALALDLLLAVMVTSLLRTRLGYRRWRAVHWAAYASWVSAIVHGLGTGSDTKTTWVLGLTVACIVSVIAAVGWRLSIGWPEQRQLRLTAGTLAVVSVAVLTGWVVAGPLKPGWARTAGTPASLLAGSLHPTTTSTAPTGAVGAITRPFSGSLQGVVTQTPVDPAGLVHVTLTLSAGGTVPGRIAAVISGQPANGGGVAETSSRVSFAPTGSNRRWTGTISALNGDQLTCTLSAGGSAIVLHLNLTIDAATGTVTGDMQGGPA